MTTIAASDAQAHFSELLERSSHGEQFIVVHGGKPLACLGPLPTMMKSAPAKDIAAKARELRARLKRDETPIKADIEQGRL